MKSKGGFELYSLLNFEPPNLQCQKCLALSTRGSLRDDYVREEDGSIRCKVCNVVYLSAKPVSAARVLIGLEHSAPIQHAQELARRAEALRDSIDERSHDPLNRLFVLLQGAKHFVHFTSFGISETLIGALKLLSHQVAVRGVVAKVDKYAREALRPGGENPYGYHVKVFEDTGKFRDYADIPHQKLIVVDGLVLIKGSANLTEAGWKKIQAGKEIVEVSTNVDEVVSVHNRYFSALWAELSDIGAIYDWQNQF